MKKISKKLSANDTSETGAHQAGMLVPKDDQVLSFFPRLDNRTKNPRCHLSFIDDSGDEWVFAFIYYNNRFFGGTRNEYRLTRMSRYISEAGLKVNDEIVLTSEKDQYFVSYERNAAIDPESKVLVLGAGWKVIDI
jgi:hypothetical protein